MGLLGKVKGIDWGLLAAGVADATAPYTLNPHQSNRAGDLRSTRQKQAEEAEMQGLLASIMGGGQPGLLGQQGSPEIPEVTSLLGASPQQPAPFQGIDLTDPQTQARIIALMSKKPQLGSGLVSLGSATRPNIQVDSASGETYDQHDRSVANRRFARPQAIGGELWDAADPNNIGRPIIEADKGQMVVYDGQGRPMVVNVPGSVGASAEMAGATAGATAGAQAQHNLAVVQGPDGRPMTGPRSAFTGGIVHGRAPEVAAAALADQSAQSATYKDLSAQVQQDRSALTNLDEAQRLLKSGAITGFGAPARLAAAKALALGGNADAKREVANTEAFQSLMQNQVLALAAALKPVSNDEVKLLGRIVGGDINLDEKSINMLIDMQRRQMTDRETRLRQLQGGGQSGTGSVSREAAIEELRRRGKWGR